jgi:hypothetical protein
MRTVCTIALATSLACALATNAAAAGAPLGFWQCAAGKRQVYLAILPDGLLNFDGAAARYTVAGSTLRVQQDGEWVSYPFRMVKTKRTRSLAVTMPNRQQLSCRAVGTASAAALRGMMCSWSGSSSSYSGTSYSSSTRVYFDGKGALSYAHEGGFTGPDGLHANRSRKRFGMYRVVGNAIYLVFPDGSAGVAGVHVRQSNGRITEVKYEGRLYAASLCN